MTNSNNENKLSNEQISDTLDEVAGLLEAQGANPFRVRAYRRGAQTIRQLEDPARQLIDSQGLAGLTQLPAIGRSLAHAVEHLAHSGRLPLLERLRGDNAPERIFATVPDIGPGLAKRIHETLGIETLEELESAAHDGRLAEVAGMGKKRLLAVRESLAGRFARSRRQERQVHPQASNDPVPVAELLGIDAKYRRLAEQDKLPRIAPRRFNPTRAAWLPILHTHIGNRHYTALFSNTARAHKLGTIHDWVVIYRDDDHAHGRWTVITAHYGRLSGLRIIRGREQECEAHYLEQALP